MMLKSFFAIENYFEEGDESISRIALGKWFLKRSILLKEEIDNDEVDGIDLAYWEGNRQLLREFAVDCLGEEKVSLLEHSDDKVEQ